MGLEVAGVCLMAEIRLLTILGDSEDGISIQEIAENTGVDSLKLGLLLIQTVKKKNLPLQNINEMHSVMC